MCCMEKATPSVHLFVGTMLLRECHNVDLNSAGHTNHYMPRTIAAEAVLVYTTSRVDDTGRRDTHLGTPDAGTVIQEGPCLADLVDVSHVPDVETVVIVDTRQLVIVFVQTHGHGVRIARGALLLHPQLAVNHTCAHFKLFGNVPIKIIVFII